MVTLILHEAFIDGQKTDLTQPFFYCVEHGHTLAVETLLQKHNVDSLMQNSLGLTTLQIAKVSEDQHTMALPQSAITIDLGATTTSEAVSPINETTDEFQSTFELSRARLVELVEA